MRGGGVKKLEILRAWAGVSWVYKLMKPTPTKEFRVKRIIDERLADRKRRVEQRLDKNHYPADRSRPMLRSPHVQFELAGRGVGTC